MELKSEMVHFISDCSQHEMYFCHCVIKCMRRLLEGVMHVAMMSEIMNIAMRHESHNRQLLIKYSITNELLHIVVLYGAFVGWS